MKRIHILGRKNHGKTTLVVELVEYFSALGLQVGTIKHTQHVHQLDMPGKDSYRHRQAGASVVGILSGGENALYWTPAEVASDDDRYEQLAPHFAACDLVLVEGHALTTARKVEVWRDAIDPAPMARDDASIAAIITDDDPQVAAPTWPRRDIKKIADAIQSLLART